MTLLAVVAVLYFTVFTISVTIDGRQLRLSRGATVKDIMVPNIAPRSAGNLVSARDRHVLRPQGGDDPYAEVDGQRAHLSDQLKNSATVTTHNGADVVEPVEVKADEVPMPFEYQGKGPIETVLTNGAPGVKKVTVGTVSGQVVSEQVTQPPITRVILREGISGKTKMIALTFDDGPWPGSTKQIVRILEQNGVVATFFEIGRQVRSSPSLSRLVADAGMEIGNHSETHPLNLGHLSAKSVSDEITRAEYDIEHATGQRPKFFRPPGGNTTGAMYPVLSKLDMQWVQWDIDTDDWKMPSSANIVNRVMRGARPGAVVLMHDGGGNRSHTVAALPTIIKKLKAEGYVFVKMSALRVIPHKMG